MDAGDDGTRDGVRWSDEQQRLGWVYALRTLGVLLALLLLAALAGGGR